MKYAYLLLNLLTLAGPLARSFEPRIRFWEKWKALFPAMGMTLLFFISWDVLFTHWGVWGFTPDYLVGLDIVNLPVEEWLFFFTVPYACLFIYEVLKHVVRRDLVGPVAWWIAGGLMASGVLLLILFSGRMYTTTVVAVMMGLLALQLFWLRSPWLGRFFLAFVVSIVPFLIVNGILTGAVTEKPIVWYSDGETMGLRLGTIPCEDFIYALDLLLLNTMLFEGFQRRWG